MQDFEGNTLYGENFKKLIYFGNERIQKNSLEEKNIFDTKYKTELCKKFQNTGKCPYGYKCRFAHGKEELLAKLQGNNYKKKPCKSFTIKGFCPYGSRCSFRHDERKFTETSLSFYYLQLFLFKYANFNFPKYSSNKNFSKRNEKRLPVFQSTSIISFFTPSLSSFDVHETKGLNTEHNSSISTISNDECDKKSELKSEEVEYKSNIKSNLSNILNHCEQKEDSFDNLLMKENKEKMKNLPEKEKFQAQKSN